MTAPREALAQKIGTAQQAVRHQLTRMHRVIGSVHIADWIITPKLRAAVYAYGPGLDACVEEAKREARRGPKRAKINVPLSENGVPFPQYGIWGL